MNYQVLARKYRPRSFQEMVGQEIVLRALTYALEKNHLHHAYLFTGSRGVGKTSLARLFTKCLNCTVKVSATPCNACSTCIAVNEGRFIDLIEIDAASRTKVEDTRELLAQMQYGPTAGRYKVYLIDEVHRLSNHSFDALLKTLEEPPAHIIFLLATTEPKRLPATTLSRCLQFHLKNLSPDQITEQLKQILKQETVGYEIAALDSIAQAAEGSLRDALSFLEQAILCGKGYISLSNVQALLGHLQAADQYAIIEALINEDASTLMEIVARLSREGIDFEQALVALLATFHQISVAQRLVPESKEVTHKIIYFAEILDPETVQLYYQIALIGRRDLSLAPTQRLGFEMSLLRMLAFQPASTKHFTEKVSRNQAVDKPAQAQLKKIALQKNIALSLPPNSNTSSKEDTIKWELLVKNLSITGITRLLALNCILEKKEADHIHLTLDPSQTALLNNRQEALLREALTQYFKKPIALTIRASQEGTSMTPAQLNMQQQTARQVAAHQTINQDPVIVTLMDQFNATIESGSVYSKEKGNFNE